MQSILYSNPGVLHTFDCSQLLLLSPVKSGDGSISKTEFMDAMQKWVALTLEQSKDAGSGQGVGTSNKAALNMVSKPGL